LTTRLGKQLPGKLARAAQAKLHGLRVPKRVVGFGW
jgi:hypothetical protein